MSSFQYNSDKVNNAIDLLQDSKTKLSYTASEFSSALSEIVTASRGYLEIDTETLPAIPEQVTSSIDSLIGIIEDKQREVEEYDAIPDWLRPLATLAMGVLKIGEGVLTAGEQLVDGFLTIVGWGGGAIDMIAGTNFQEGIADAIETDHVGDFFADQYENGALQGINDASYFSHDSTAANVLKGFGVAAGYVAVAAVGGGAFAAAGGGSAAAGASAAMGNIALNAGIAGLGGLGSGTQTGLQEGLSFDEASVQGVVQAGFQAGTVFAAGALANKLTGAGAAANSTDDVARAALGSADDATRAASSSVDDAARAALGSTDDTARAASSSVDDAARAASGSADDTARATSGSADDTARAASSSADDAASSASSSSSNSSSNTSNASSSNNTASNGGMSRGDSFTIDGEEYTFRRMSRDGEHMVVQNKDGQLGQINVKTGQTDWVGGTGPSHVDVSQIPLNSNSTSTAASVAGVADDVASATTSSVDDVARATTNTADNTASSTVLSLSNVSDTVVNSTTNMASGNAVRNATLATNTITQSANQMSNAPANTGNLSDNVYVNTDFPDEIASITEDATVIDSSATAGTVSSTDGTVGTLTGSSNGGTYVSSGASTNASNYNYRVTNSTGTGTVTSSVVQQPTTETMTTPIEDVTTPNVNETPTDTNVDINTDTSTNSDNNMSGNIIETEEPVTETPTTSITPSTGNNNVTNTVVPENATVTNENYNNTWSNNGGSNINSGFSNIRDNNPVGPDAELGYEDVNPEATTPITEETPEINSNDTSGDTLDVITVDDGSTEPNVSTGSGGTVIPAILGVGAASAAIAAGVHHIQSKNKENEDYYEDESEDTDTTYEGNNDSQIITPVEDDYNIENKQVEPVPKYKAGTINKLALEDGENITIDNDIPAPQKEELE